MITIVLCAIIVLLIAFILYKETRIVKISDNIPQSGSKKDAWLKLTNEGKDYLTFEDGKVKLKIVK